MLFNSPEFLLFLPIVFGLYWFVVQRNLKAQNQELWLTALGLPNKSHLCPVINPMSKSFGAVLLTLALLTTLTADAQRRRPPRDGGGGQTPKTVQESIRSAEEKEAARTTELRTGWSDAKESHYKKQDKATRKRMRQNDRRRKRAAQGREIPWWRRIFGKPNRYR